MATQSGHLIDRTEALCRAGRVDAAISEHEELLRHGRGSLFSPVFLGLACESAGMPGRARHWQGLLARTRHDRISATLSAALASDFLSDSAKATALLKDVIASHPDLPAAHVYLACLSSNAGDAKQALRYAGQAHMLTGGLSKLASDATQPRAVRTRFAHAMGLLNEHADGLLRAAMKQAGLAVDSRLSQAVWRAFSPQPASIDGINRDPGKFYLPFLAPRPVLAAENLEWTVLLAASWQAIRDEFLSEVDIDRDTMPYISAAASLSEKWSHLQGTTKWGSIMITRGGEWNRAVLDRLPATNALLKRLGAEHIPASRLGAPSESFFSVLQPHVRIPPHAGRTNAVMTVHLPLIVPQGARFRVADIWHDWKEGETFIFDDSFDHEARNDTDHVRVVLIFEIWHPELDIQERHALDLAFHHLGEWEKSVAQSLQTAGSPIKEASP